MSSWRRVRRTLGSEVGWRRWKEVKGSVKQGATYLSKYTAVTPSLIFVNLPHSRAKLTFGLIPLFIGVMKGERINYDSDQRNELLVGYRSTTTSAKAQARGIRHSRALLGSANRRAN